jgi:hypothetical protein
VPEISPVSEKISAVQPVSVRLVSELQRVVDSTRDEDFTRGVVQRVPAVQCSAARSSQRNVSASYCVENRC